MTILNVDTSLLRTRSETLAKTIINFIAIILAITILQTPYAVPITHFFTLETDYPSRRVIRLIDHLSKHKHKMNYPEELFEYRENLRLLLLYCILSNSFENLAEYKNKQSAVRLMQDLCTQTDHRQDE